MGLNEHRICLSIQQQSTIVQCRCDDRPGLVSGAVNKVFSTEFLVSSKRDFEFKIPAFAADMTT